MSVMNTVEVVVATIGAAIIALVLWKISRHGAVPATLDVDPDDRRSWGE